MVSAQWPRFQIRVRSPNGDSARKMGWKMRDDKDAGLSVREFDEDAYLKEHADARLAIEAGLFTGALDHFFNYGIDERRAAAITLNPPAIRGEIDRLFVSAGGYVLALGWLADEGRPVRRLALARADFFLAFPAVCALRHRRSDVESALGEGGFDYGFVALLACPSRLLLKQPLSFRAEAESGTFEVEKTPEILSDKRLLDAALGFLASVACHTGREAAMLGWLDGPAGETIVQLFRRIVAANSAPTYRQRFGRRRDGPTFVTALFGSVEALRLQPALFRQAGIAIGEWIYVCNSPELAEEAMSLARIASDVYGLSINVIVNVDNVGFGAANNVAVGLAESDAIFLINPDVYPAAPHAEALRRMMASRHLDTTLWGGLLFYDDETLMHSGMRVEWEPVFPSGGYATQTGPRADARPLARVEHYDKSAPFASHEWRGPRQVEAITGAVMAFSKPSFEKIGGFSTSYIYGHYEDADLSLRWAQSQGSVCVDPELRLVHLEGQGARAHGDIYRGAAMVNRCLFSLIHGVSAPGSAGGD